MEALIYLDTHVVFWLYAEAESPRLSAGARSALSGAEELRISPMVSLELTYLHEVGRIGEPAPRMVDELRERIGLIVCPAGFQAVAREAERHSWTRDPFDRLIVAQASLHDAPLLTADSVIREHYARTVW